MAQDGTQLVKVPTLGNALSFFIILYIKGINQGRGCSSGISDLCYILCANMMYDMQV